MARGRGEKPAEQIAITDAESFMRLALREARKGLGRTSPNPVVGAALVKGGKVIALGHHQRAGGPHAEIVALRRAGAKARGADLYSTLEPCNHFGRTPPCTEAILKAGVRRVVVGCSDMNPIVRGRGIKRLTGAGVEVLSGVLERDCIELNRPFFTHITEKRPFVTVKVAATADGKIATATGDSKWVTGDKARERVHQLRDHVDAVLVGAGTVRADDPQLSARPKGKLSRRQPMRVVVSSTLDLPAKARIFAPGAKVLVLTCSRDEAKTGLLRSRGAEVVQIPGRAGKVDLRAVLEELGRREVVHLLVEGGAELFGQFLEAGLVDELLLFIAPKVLGDGLSWAKLGSVRAKMAEAIDLAHSSLEQVGEDVLLTARLREKRPASARGA